MMVLYSHFLGDVLVNNGAYRPILLFWNLTIFVTNANLVWSLSRETLDAMNVRISLHLTNCNCIRNYLQIVGGFLKSFCWMFKQCCWFLKKQFCAILHIGIVFFSPAIYMWHLSFVFDMLWCSAYCHIYRYMDINLFYMGARNSSFDKVAIYNGKLYFKMNAIHRTCLPALI